MEVGGWRLEVGGRQRSAEVGRGRQRSTANVNDISCEHIADDPEHSGMKVEFTRKLYWMEEGEQRAGRCANAIVLSRAQDCR